MVQSRPETLGATGQFPENFKSMFRCLLQQTSHNNLAPSKQEYISMLQSFAPSPRKYQLVATVSASNSFKYKSVVFGSCYRLQTFFYLEFCLNF